MFSESYSIDCFFISVKILDSKSAEFLTNEHNKANLYPQEFPGNSCLQMVYNEIVNNKKLLFYK